MKYLVTILGTLMLFSITLMELSSCTKASNKPLVTTLVCETPNNGSLIKVDVPVEFGNLSYKVNDTIVYSFSSTTTDWTLNGIKKNTTVLGQDIKFSDGSWISYGYAVILQVATSDDVDNGYLPDISN